MEETITKKEIKEDKLEIAFKNFKKIKNSKNPKFEKLDNWLETESKVYLGESRITKQKNYFKYKRGTIVKVNFGVNPGSELCHTHFAIVINNDDNTLKETVTVVPLTSKPGYGRLPLNNLIKSAIIDNIKKKLNQDISIYEEDNAKAIELINEYRKYTNFSYAVISQIATVSKSRMIISNNKFDIINKVRCPDKILEEIDNAIIKTMTGIKLMDIAPDNIKIDIKQ